MFSTQPQHHHLSVIFHHLLDHRRNPTTLHLSKRPHLLTSLSSPHHETHDTTTQVPTTPPNEDQILRKHNAKSTALLYHLPLPHDPQSQKDEKLLLQLSMARTRTPQFPGSIYVQSPGDNDVATSLPPLRTLFDENDEDYEILLKAVEIRRSVTMEIFMEAMRKKGKFGITYSTNLASRAAEFIDFVMIQAASMKELPQFSNSSFNVRAETFLDNSNVVPIIR